MSEVLLEIESLDASYGSAQALEGVSFEMQASALLGETPNNDIRNRPLDQKPYWHVERARIGDSRKVPVELIVNGESVARQEIEADGLLARCLQAGQLLGMRLAEPGEFTQRAFLNGKLDLAQAEAVADLIDASTEAAARSASRSLAGACSDQRSGLAGAIVRRRRART